MPKKKEWAPTPTRMGKYINYKIQLYILYNLRKYRETFTEREWNLLDGYYQTTYEALRELYEGDSKKREIMEGLCLADIKELLKFYEQTGRLQPLNR